MLAEKKLPSEYTRLCFGYSANQGPGSWHRLVIKMCNWLGRGIGFLLRTKPVTLDQFSRTAVFVTSSRVAWSHSPQLKMNLIAVHFSSDPLYPPSFSWSPRSATLNTTSWPTNPSLQPPPTHNKQFTNKLIGQYFPRLHKHHNWVTYANIPRIIHHYSYEMSMGEAGLIGVRFNPIYSSFYVILGLLHRKQP